MNNSVRILSIVTAVGMVAGAPAVAAPTKAAPAKAMPAKTAKARPAKTAKVSALTASFRGYDANHDGSITETELAKSRMSKKVEAKLDRTFRSADRNHDGKITAGEYNGSVSRRLAAIERRA